MGRLGLSINKKLVSQVLSLEEARKLKDLGIDLSGGAFIWRKLLQDWDRKNLEDKTNYLLEHNLNPVVMGFEQFDEIPIATASELFEFLPREFVNDGNVWNLSITPGPENKYYIEYSDTPLGNPIISVSGTSLLSVSYKAILELLNLGINIENGRED